MAEWSKALASGASPQGRGFEPHRCHSIVVHDQDADRTHMKHKPPAAKRQVNSNSAQTRDIRRTDRQADMTHATTSTAGRHSKYRDKINSGHI